MAKVQGLCTEGFQPVKDYLEQMLGSECEDKLQLCVYVGKECVLDLFGSRTSDTSYNGDSIQVY